MASVFNAVTGQSQQARFCQILKNEPIERKRIEDEDSAFHQRFPLKATDLEGRKRELLSKMANDLYAVIGPSGKFTDWRGSMKVFSGVEETPESKRNHQPAKLGFAIAFTPDCFDQSDTVFSLQTDKGVYGSTNISSDSPLGKALQEMNPSQGKFTASGEFLWAPPPPKGGGMWVPPVDTRYHFYIVPNTAFYEGNYRFFVRFSQIS